jgi:hypothetical protein
MGAKYAFVITFIRYFYQHFLWIMRGGGGGGEKKNFKIKKPAFL